MSVFNDFSVFYRITFRKNTFLPITTGELKGGLVSLQRNADKDYEEGDLFKTYRRSRRSEYLAQHGDRIDSFIRNYLRFHFNVDFLHIAHSYVRTLAEANQNSWDYLDLREDLRVAFGEQIAEQMFQDLTKKIWFDQRFLSLEQLTDRCISLFVLEDWAAIS